MSTIQKHSLETITVPFDFSSYLEGLGHPFATYQVETDLGLAVVDSVEQDDVVTLQIAAGTSGSTYNVSVLVSTPSGGETITQQIYVQDGLPHINPSQYADNYATGYA